MSRFVAVSFLFMGWAFYELSGGADFQPKNTPAGDQTAAITPAPSARVTAASLVTRPVIRPADLTARKAAIRTAAEPVPQPRRITGTAPDVTLANPDLRTEAALGQIGSLGASLAPGGRLFDANTGGASIQIASLEGGLAGLAADAAIIAPVAEPEITAATPAVQAEPEKTGPDLREITASAVNLRGGPGTGYPVIGRMTLGQQVEVLADTGSGWLRLRDPGENKVGWIAASLISRKAP